MATGTWAVLGGILLCTAGLTHRLPWSTGLEETERLTRAFMTGMWAGADPDTCDPLSLTTGQILAQCRVPRVSEGVDVVVFLVYSAALFMINWGVRIALVQPVAAVMLKAGAISTTGSAEAVAGRRRKMATKVDKFSQTAMEQLFYGVFTGFGCVMVLSQPWMWPSAEWWRGFDRSLPSPFDGSRGVEVGVHSYMTKAFAAYYVMYAARYFQGLISVFLEHKRKDFMEMVTHHVVTCSVVVVSYTWGWNRVGVVIMLIFDPSDVPLHTAKMFKYISERRPGCHFDTAADLMFVVFMTSFFALRLVFYPYVVWSAHVESYEYFSHDTGAWACKLLLDLLLLINAFWGYLILRVLYKLVVKGHVEDNRSDDEDEPEPAEDKKQQ